MSNETTQPSPACHYAPIIHGTPCAGRPRLVRNKDGEVWVCRAHFVGSEDRPVS